MATINLKDFGVLTGAELLVQLENFNRLSVTDGVVTDSKQKALVLVDNSSNAEVALLDISKDEVYDYTNLEEVITFLRECIRRGYGAAYCCTIDETDHFHYVTRPKVEVVCSFGATGGILHF